MAVRPGEQYRFEQEVFVNEHRLGSDLGLANGEIVIQRGSDGLYWNGSTFVSGVQTLTTTAAGGTTDPHHFFDFTIPAGASDGEVFNIILRAARSTPDPATESKFHTLVRTTADVGGGGTTVIVIDD